MILILRGLEPGIEDLRTRTYILAVAQLTILMRLPESNRVVQSLCLSRAASLRTIFLLGWIRPGEISCMLYGFRLEGGLAPLFLVALCPSVNPSYSDASELRIR